MVITGWKRVAVTTGRKTERSGNHKEEERIPSGEEEIEEV